MQAWQQGTNAHDQASASGRRVTVAFCSLRARGAAPTAAPRVILSVFVSVFALALTALALTATAALAAAPETPELTVKPIFASIAVFNGTLSPKGGVAVGDSYKFLYNASKTECAGGSETALGAVSSGTPEIAPEEVRGLTPATEYTVCLQISGGETATSSPVTFKTAAAVPPETPQALPPSDIEATSATLSGVINPHREGEPGRYSFVYAESSSVCTGGAGTAQETMRESSPQPVSLKADSLQPDTTYTFCLKAINALGEATLSSPVTFTTTSLPEMRTVEPVTDVTGTTAILHGVLDPKGASPEVLVEYDFFYVYAGGESCDEPFVAQAAPQPPGVASGAMGEAVEASLSGLTPDTEYSVCLGARDTGGEFDFSALSAPVSFKTVALPPDVLSESVSERWATAVLLETRVNNEAEPTECFFQYGEASVSEHEVSCGTIGGYSEPTLAAKVEGLTPGHTYRWRTVAKSNAGTSDGKEESFTTATTPEPPELSIAPFSWSPGIGVPVTAPANASSEPQALFDWGACPAAGYCVGVGYYTDEAGNREAMAATRIGGSWGQAVEIALPAGAASSGQKAGFGLAAPSVACTEPGDCLAVGHYMNEGGSEEAMTVTETGGVWGTASEIKLPANAAGDPEADLASIACLVAGSCVARGEYSDTHGDREAMVADETGGVWGPASDVKLPTNSQGDYLESHLGAVACPAAGSCVGIGEYHDASTSTEEALVVTETGGTWAQASQIALPANAGEQPESRLDSVVCVPSGPCVADGSYTDRAGDREAMVTEEAGGAWGPASEIQAPSNVAVNSEVSFGFARTSIACASTGSCVLAARYTDNAGAGEGMVADETGGVWGPAREIAAPANAASKPEVTVYPACPASGACVLVGVYLDAEEHAEAMVAEGTDGAWGQAREIAAPENAAANPHMIFGEVQCPTVGSCVAFGQYTNHAGVTRDMEVTGLEAPENTVAPIVSGTAKVGQTLSCSEGTWIAASPTSYAYRWLRDGVAIGGAQSSVYTVTAADEGHSISCEVTATNAVGSKSAASANSVAVHEEARERREEEEAAAKKRQEAKIAVASSVSLTGSILRVRSNGKGSVKLACTGTAPCTGKLTLTVTSKGKGKRGKKAKAERIGTAAFSIPAGASGVVTIKLTAAGRALLKAGHGKLGASLTILKSSPAPASTARETVQLVQKKAAKGKKRRR
jgi:cytochrome c551/c552